MGDARIVENQLTHLPVQNNIFDNENSVLGRSCEYRGQTFKVYKVKSLFSPVILSERIFLFTNVNLK